MRLKPLLPLIACTVPLLAPGLSGGREPTPVYFGLLYKPVCDSLIDDFESDTRANYAAWEQQNRAEIAELEADAEFQKRRRAALVPPPPELTATKAREISGTCDRIAAIFEAAAPADPRFADPERTWEAFRSALRAADREAMVACLTAGARKTHANVLRAMSDEELRRMNDSIAEMRLANRSGGFQEALIVQKDGKVGTVVFMKAGPNWRIGQM